MPQQSTALFHGIVSRHGPAGPNDPKGVRHDFVVTTSIHHVFDIYIPDALREMNATDLFIQRVTALVPGATIYRGAEGRWQGQAEAVQVLRVSVEIVDCEAHVIYDVNGIRSAFRTAAVDLLKDLTGKHGHIEQAIFFNDWTTHGTLIQRAQPPVPAGT
jgi:hypothetical protein